MKVVYLSLLNYGERGVRTLGTLSSTHAFQACTFDHSDISPKKPKPEQRREGDSVFVANILFAPQTRPNLLPAASCRLTLPSVGGDSASNPRSVMKGLHLAERGGFEPPEPCGSAVFETVRFNHSRISPVWKLSLPVKKGLPSQTARMRLSGFEPPAFRSAI